MIPNMSNTENAILPALKFGVGLNIKYLFSDRFRCIRAFQWPSLAVVPTTAYSHSCWEG